MRLGVDDEARVTDELVAGSSGAPPAFDRPLRVIYGERDRILPDIATTVDRLRGDVPHAVVTALPHAGHVVQEDAADEVGTLLAQFFAPAGYVDVDKCTHGVHNSTSTG
jgi:pimeloyl-ACP methyl ester carboxylesterase